MNKSTTRAKSRKPAQPKLNIGIQPLEDNVLLYPESPESVSKGGIILPDSSKDAPSKASVMAVGPGRYENGHLIPMSVAVGDIVMFEVYAGSTIEIDGKKCKMVRQSSITAKLT